MKFKYSARTKEGELQAGFVEAANKETAVNILTGYGLFILDIASEEKSYWSERFFSIFNRVKTVDLMVFTRQFATLMESEIPLTEAVKNLEIYTKNPLLKEVIHDLSMDISSGLSLSQALERRTGIFPEFYINIIKISEVTGRLDKEMGFLADYLEKESKWHSKIVNALIYPAILFGIFLLVAVMMTIFVFPQIKPVFEESGVKLPWMTTFILGAMTFVLNWWWLIIIMAGLLVAVLYEYFKSEEGKLVASDLIIKIPILGEMFKKIYVSRFSELTNVLITGGIPISQAIEIAAHSIGNYLYRDVLHDMAERIRAGEQFSALLLQNDNYFPFLVGQMVAIGENTGRLDELLSRISSFYTREAEDMLDRLTELIQPIVLLIIGVLVGVLFASILVPIYNLAQGFKI